MTLISLSGSTPKIVIGQKRLRVINGMGIGRRGFTLRAHLLTKPLSRNFRRMPIDSTFGDQKLNVLPALNRPPESRKSNLMINFLRNYVHWPTSTKARIIFTTNFNKSEGCWSLLEMA